MTILLLMLGFIFVSSIVSFLLYGIDKHLAVFEKRRVPVWLLIFTACIGGAFGALCAMIFFRHKTNKTLFLVLIPILLLMQLSVVVLCKML